MSDVMADLPRIGLIGLGRMGQSIGRRLLAAGYRVGVHNRTRAKADVLCAAGAEWAATPAELAAGCDIVLTVLRDDAAVRDVYTGREGLLERPSSALLVEMSTIAAPVTLQLRDEANMLGVTLMDAALAGPPKAALAGQLLVLAGGPPDAMELAGPVLHRLGRRVVHLGPTGSGVTMKLVLMNSMAVYFAGLAEALAIGSQAGLERADMLDVILDSHGAPPALRDRLPVLLDARLPVGFDVAGVAKDLRAVIDTAELAEVPTAVAAAALGTFTASAEDGYADHDLIFVLNHLTEQSRQRAPESGLRRRISGDVVREAS